MTAHDAHCELVRNRLGLPEIDRREHYPRRQSDSDLEALRAHLGVAVAGRHDRRATRGSIRSLVTLVRSLEAAR